MKALIFVPLEYTIGHMLVEGFEENGWHAKIIDYIHFMPEWRNKLFVKTVGFPNKITNYIKPDYFKQINKIYLEIIESEEPEIIVIYNNQHFAPELFEKIGKTVKIAFILGDNPLFSNSSDTNLAILKYSSYTICPDTHWKKELSSIGISKITFDILGYSKKYNHKLEKISDEDRNQYSNDLVFVGRNYGNSFGYKRSLFYNQFVNLDIKLYGSLGWNKWLRYFPELSDKMHPLKKRISHEELNLILNCCKIYPIDQNPGIINGIHSRILESIGSEILPIVEYRTDIDLLFSEVKVPVIKNYSDGPDIAKYFLRNESERIKRIKELKEYVDKNYIPKFCINKLINHI